MEKLIYAADDEENIRELLRAFLTDAGYRVEVFETGDLLMDAFRKKPCDLVVLDVMMPGTDGLTVCRELRKTSSVPIIILTARDSETDFVTGINLGGDDYLTKPFRPTALIMRIKAMFRRMEIERESGKSDGPGEEIRFEDLTLSEKGKAVYCGGSDVRLTGTELKFLAYLMRNINKAVSREELLTEVWGYETEVETRVTDETMRRIRKKLLEAGSRAVVQTVWGYGYKLSHRTEEIQK